MTVPLIILAILAALGGLMNIPALFGGGSWLAGFLAPVFADAVTVQVPLASLSHAEEWLLMGVALIFVLGMIGWSYSRFVVQKAGLLPDVAERPFVVKLLSNKYYVDEVYDLLFQKPILWLSRVFHDIVEVRIIDRAVNGLGNLVVWTGNTVRYIQTGNVGFYMFIMILGVILILFFNILI
jgi:NADH-quinone oxidoreductase subunit L